MRPEQNYDTVSKSLQPSSSQSPNSFPSRNLFATNLLNSSQSIITLLGFTTFSPHLTKNLHLADFCAHFAASAMQLQAVPFAPKKSTSFHGIAKGLTAVTSTAMGVVGGALHGIGNGIKPLDGGATRSFVDNKLMDNQFYNTKHKTFQTNTSTHSLASNVNSGNDLTITSLTSPSSRGVGLASEEAEENRVQSNGDEGGNITIKGSNLIADNTLTLNTENLNLLTSQEMNIYSMEDKVSRTLTFKNYNEGSVTTNNIINPVLIAGTDTSGNQKIAFNITGNVVAQYKAGDYSAEINQVDSQTDKQVNSQINNPNLTYLASLKSQIDPSNLKLEPIQFNEQSWAQAARGLNDVGTAGLAVGITAATVLSMGTLAPISAGFAAGGWAAVGAGAAVGATSTVASTVAVSGSNASMNANGSVWNQTKSISDSSYKATTSRESLEQIAISALASGITAGLTPGTTTTPGATTTTANGVNGVANASNTVNAANTATNSITSSISRLSTNFSTAITKVTIGATANAVATTLVKGISNGELSINSLTTNLTENLKNNVTGKDATRNLLIQAAGEAFAKEIGTAAHSPELDGNGKIILNESGEIARQIDKSTQLVLHGALGCGLGIVSNGGGNGSGGAGGCASGAAAGVVGELTGENMRNSGFNQQQGTAIAGVSGAMASMFTSLLLGQDDSEVAQNMQFGNFIAGNAAANNAYRNAYKKMFPEGINDKETEAKVREAVREAALTGDIDTLKGTVEELTGKTPTDADMKAISDLHKDRDFAQLRRDIGATLYDKFADKYMLQTGIFFDGTANDMNNKDPGIAEVTNVARMRDSYDSESRRYISGVGTSGGLDVLCQGLGCGASGKQQEAIDFLSGVLNGNSSKEYLFFPVDVVSFSRGATTASDFINQINNENYWNLGIMPRSSLMFDPVASYGIPGNGIDLGKDFSIPLNVIAIQINAANETRNHFDSQSLYTSTGQNPSPKNWIQMTLPGSHSDIGGGIPNGDQGKTQDMAFYSMRTMINEAESVGIKFKPIPQNQQPSERFTNLMNLYNQAQTNLQNNPTITHQNYFNSLQTTINAIAVHDSTFGGTGKIYNYSIGNERGVFYPNDKYLMPEDLRNRIELISRPVEYGSSSIFNQQNR